jgi:5-methylcytosine-specific restriction protein A
MPDRVPTYTPGASLKQRRQAYEQNIARAADRRFYQSPAWRRLRAAYLQSHPLCEKCQHEGRHTPAQHVHHMLERKVHPQHALSWTNLEALCLPCHNSRHARWASPGDVEEKKTSGIPRRHE